LHAGELVGDGEALEETELAGRVLARAGEMVVCRPRGCDAAFEESMRTVRVLALGSEFWLVVLVIRRAECKTLDGNECVVNGVEWLEATAERAVCWLGKWW
jgi:hypothetical protein